MVHLHAIAYEVLQVVTPILPTSIFMFCNITIVTKNSFTSTFQACLTFVVLSFIFTTTQLCMMHFYLYPQEKYFAILLLLRESF